MYPLAFFQLNLILLFFAHIANLSRGPYASTSFVPKIAEHLNTNLPSASSHQPKSQVQQTASLIYNQLYSSIIGRAPGLELNHNCAISYLCDLRQGGSTLESQFSHLCAKNGNHLTQSEYEMVVVKHLSCSLAHCRHLSVFLRIRAELRLLMSTQRKRCSVPHTDKTGA